jgi:hypothetical protein
MSFVQAARVNTPGPRDDRVGRGRRAEGDDQMIKARHTSAALLVGALALVAAGCGGGGKHSSTSTTASTNQTTSTGTTARSTSTTATTPKPASPAKPTTPINPKASQTPLADTPAKTLTFSGTGVKDIGKPNPLRLPQNSTIEWTNDGAIFQIIPASVHVQSPVNSKGHSGTATIRKGAYYGFLINAVGHWTVKIIPNG